MARTPSPHELSVVRQRRAIPEPRSDAQGPLVRARVKRSVLLQGATVT